MLRPRGAEFQGQRGDGSVLLDHLAKRGSRSVRRRLPCSWSSRGPASICRNLPSPGPAPAQCWTLLRIPAFETIPTGSPAPPLPVCRSCAAAGCCRPLRPCSGVSCRYPTSLLSVLAIPVFRGLRLQQPCCDRQQPCCDRWSRASLPAALPYPPGVTAAVARAGFWTAAPWPPAARDTRPSAIRARLLP